MDECIDDLLNECIYRWMYVGDGFVLFECVGGWINECIGLW